MRGLAFGPGSTPQWIIVGNAGEVREGSFDGSDQFNVGTSFAVVAGAPNLRTAARGSVGGVDSWIVAGTENTTPGDNAIRVAPAPLSGTPTWRTVVVRGTVGDPGVGSVPGVIEVVAIENGTVLLGAANGIWRLSDSETDTFYRVTETSQNKILGIAAVSNPGTPTGVWLASSDAGMLRSSDDGRTWVAVTPDPSLPIASGATAQASSRQIRFAVDGGVVTAVPADEAADVGQNRTLRSKDGGLTWKYLTIAGVEVGLDATVAAAHHVNRRDIAFGNGRWVIVTTASLLIGDRVP